MTRRFQFSLRALLAGTSVFCAVLGIRQVYLAHLANYVVLEQAKIGEPIRVRGQFFQRAAADSTVFWVRIVHHGPSGKWRDRMKGRAERTGFGTYRFVVEFPPTRFNKSPRWLQPGKVDLYLEPLDGNEVIGQGLVKQ